MSFVSQSGFSGQLRINIFVLQESICQRSFMFTQTRDSELVGYPILNDITSFCHDHQLACSFTESATALLDCNVSVTLVLAEVGDTV